MAIILQRLTDNRLQLGREEIIRPFNFGSNWNLVRIAALIQVYGASSFNQPLSYPQIALGVATGTNGLLVDTTGDSVGAAPSSAWANTAWSPSAGGGLTSGQNGGAGLQKIGAAWLTVTQGSSPFVLPGQDSPGSTTVRRCPIIVDIAKSTYVTGAPNPYSYQLFGPSSMADVTPGVFFDRIQTYSAPTGMTSFSTTTIPVTGNFQHNAAFLMWANCTPPLDVAAFAAIRFS